MLKRILGAAIVAAFLAVPAAYAAGLWPTLPAASGALSGAETIPADTNLAQGAQPQTELVTPSQLKGYVFGNVGDTATGTATASGTTTATATLNAGRGVVTSASLTTAAAATYVLTLTNSAVTASSIVLASVGTAGTGNPSIGSVVPGAGSVVITVQNIAASAALNNTVKIAYVVVN